MFMRWWDFKKYFKIILHCLYLLCNILLIYFQNTGVGKLRPNVVMMGFMSGWRTKEDQGVVEEYFNVFQ